MGSNLSSERFPTTSGGHSGSASSRHSHLFTFADYDSIAAKEKKKKASKFATLRKKLMRARRHSRSYDYGKALRDLTSTWSIRELHSLGDEYEALAALKELTILSTLARPNSSTIVEDLASLFQKKYCTDVDLVYGGVVFPAHRAILCIRCAFFRELLSQYPEYGAQIPVIIQTPGVDVGLFSALLRYLYTGDFGLEQTRLHCLKKLLAQLASEFGAPNSLEQDLRTLLDTGAYADAILVFSTDSESSSSAVYSTSSRQADITVAQRRNELHCHRAILAARSSFFRNLISRRARSGEEMTERVLNAPTCIVLDESVIPRRFSRVLLNAIYLDNVDLTCILRTSQSLNTLSEVQAMVSGRGHMTITEEAMELYHIGRFLDFPSLAQGCEDIIAESLTIENLLSVLQWSKEAHGSVWVHQQALHFLREEFLQVAHSLVFYELSKDYIVEAISSDFLQASELDVLTAVIKWGEHKLMKRIEEREPNILSQTAHSISKKGVKKRDLNDSELREILSDLLQFIRTDHIIPANSDALINAVRRGLVSLRPSLMMGSEIGQSSASAWVRTRNAALYVKPRLFTPYCEEAKALIKEQTSKGPDSSVVQLRVVHTCAIPDALYMLDEQLYTPRLHRQWSFSSSTVDIIAGTIPVPDKIVLDEMRRREAELSRTRLAQRAYSLLSMDRSSVAHQIHLRIVREFGLPDSTVEVLQGSIDHAPHRQDMCLPLAGACYLTPVRSRHALLCQHHTTHRLHQYSRTDSRLSTSMIQPVVHPCNHMEESGAYCDGPPPRNMMPDIAMATASVNRLALQERDLMYPADLDLGDGTTHSGSGTLFV